MLGHALCHALSFHSQTITHSITNNQFYYQNNQSYWKTINPTTDLLLWGSISFPYATDRDDMLSYMGHMVKVMELAARYEWLSVVKFDDEFRHNQALYNYPWLYESRHLHATLLHAKTPASFPVAAEQKSKKQPSGQSLGTKVAPALYTADDRIIYKRYNGQYGCELVACNFVHVCNRNIGISVLIQHRNFEPIWWNNHKVITDFLSEK